MATPVANLKIKLDGEAEYRQALSSIDKATKELGSELNMLSAKFSKNGDSLEALSEKNDVLNKKFEKQQERVDLLRKAVEEAESIQKKAQEAFDKTASTLDAGSEEYKAMAAQVQKAANQTADWQIKLNNAEAELYKLQNTLDDNTDALHKAQVQSGGLSTVLDKLKTAMAKTKEEGGGVKAAFANVKEEFSGVTIFSQGLGEALTDVAGKFGIELPEGAQKAVQSLNGINAGAAVVATGIGLIAAAVVKAEKALVDLTKESAATASEILDLAAVSGQSADTIQEFAYASEMIGVSYDRIRDSLKEVTNKMQEARDGSEDVAAAWDKLGVSITDAEGNLRSAEDVFYDTIDALGQVQNRTERDAIAMDLMSESAQELNPLIDAGSAALRDYADEAHEMGYVLDNEALTALDNVDNGFSRLSNTTDALKNQIAAEFAPYLSEALEDIRGLIEKVGKALIDSGAVDAFGSILESSIAIAEPIGELITTLLPALTIALKPVVSAVAILADGLNVLTGMFTFDFERVNTAMGLNAKYGMLSAQQQASGKYDGYRYTESTGWIESGTHTEAELRAEYAKNPTGTYEYWKELHGYNAAGTDYWYGGRTLIGENGPEMAILPQGTRILTAQESRQVTGGDTYNITIPASSIKEFEDIIRIVKNRRRIGRMERQ